jgi:hypothetical protein
VSSPASDTTDSAGPCLSWLKRHTAVLGLVAAVAGTVAVGVLGRTGGSTPPTLGYVSLAADPNSPPLTLAAAPARTRAGGPQTVRLVTSQPGRGDDVAEGTADLSLGTSSLTLRTPAGTTSQRLTAAAAVVDTGQGPHAVQSARNLAPADDPTVPVDPSLALQLLGGVTTRVSPPVRDTVDGVATAHYTATVNLDRTAAQNLLPPGVLNDLRRQLPGAEMPVQVWTDRAGAIRRASIVLDSTSRRTLTVTLTPAAAAS